jgi:ABC-type multidrug transport system ATPase subunit
MEPQARTTDGDASVCPYCSHGMSSDGACPSCGRPLDAGEWPFDEVYSPAGLQARPDGKGTFFFIPESEQPLRTELKAEVRLPRKIPLQDPLRVGNTHKDSIRIDSPDVKAVFYRNRRSRACWVLDQSQFASVRVNGELVRNVPLRANDQIDIAGVKLSFDGERIDRARDESGGLSLTVDELGVTLGDATILRDVSFSVAPGEFVGVLGPSGCGKSTLLQCIAGLIPPERRSGRVAFTDAAGADLTERAVGLCAYLPQNAEEMLHPGLTLHEEMTCFLAVHAGTDGDETQIEPLLELLNLAEEVNKPVSGLSGGQKRRAAIAMTLLRKPRIVLLDEPTAGLDPAADAEVMAYLGKIAKNQHIIILCSTHVLGNMNRFTRVLALTSKKKEDVAERNGRLVFCGPPSRLVNGVCPHLAAASCASDDILAEASERLSQVYATLQEGAPKLASLPSVRFPELNGEADGSHVGAPSAVAAFAGYLKRMWTAFQSAWKSWIVLFGCMPLGVVACIRVGCADDFGAPSSGAIYFCCIIALFLLGLCHSAPRLVDGRVPGRCLERLAGVPLSSYLAAKIVGSVGLCLAQTLSFCLFWQLAILLPQSWFSAKATELLVGPFDMFWTVPVLLCSSFMGALVGLSISAAVKNRATAVNWVPVVAVVALFFSQPNIGYPLSGSDEPTFPERLSYLTPTVFPQRFLAAAYQVSAAEEAVRRASPDKRKRAEAHLAKTENYRKGAALRFFALFGAYLAVAFGVLWLAEPAREREWYGR